MTITTTTLDAMTEGFIRAALWADCSPADADDNGETGGQEHLTPGANLTATARDMCDRFLTVVDPGDLYAFMDAFGDPDGGHPGEYVGHTFYLEARGHGVSFTDDAWRDDDPMTAVCGRLRDVARAFGEVEHFYIFATGDGAADLDR